MRGAALPADLPAGLAFDPSLSAADQDLAHLAEQVVRTSELAVSFCLYGLPGTGKSAFARHLAERLGLDVVEKRASDLLSMWVGETEKGIARAFQEAADRRAMLILDEADSLLRDRAGAHRSWEVTQVNEMQPEHQQRSRSANLRSRADRGLRGLKLVTAAARVPRPTSALRIACR